MTRIPPAAICFASHYSWKLILVGMALSISGAGTKNMVSRPFQIPTIIGNSDTTTLCLSPSYMLNAWYSVERLDTITDTLDLSKPGRNREGLSYPFFFPDTSEPGKVSHANNSLQVIVDTVNELTLLKKPIWARYLFHRSLGDTIEVLQDDTLVQMVKSFPVFIANTSTIHQATLELQDGSIMMVVEAMDQSGAWKPIEYWSNSWCGNSYYHQIIPPEHMVMTRSIKCSGGFYTRCRMKVSNDSNTLFSNEFFMSINESQFQQPVQKDR